ncbi:MAG: YqhA family protein [Methyloceanibacter sp.]
MRGLLAFLLGLRAIMLIGSAGAMVGSLLMFLQGGFYLYEAWHTIMSPGAEAHERAVTVPVLEAVDAFLFGIVLVIFAYGIAIGFVFTLPEGYGRRLPNWMKIEGVSQLKGILSEVVVVVLIVIFARVVVEANGNFQWSMLVLPISILLIALGLRMIELAGGKGHGGNSGEEAAVATDTEGPH